MMCRFGSSNHIPSLLYFLMHFENLIQYSECISLVPRTYNPIKNGPWELVCDAEKGFITPVTITLPSGMTGVSCTPASPPFPYSCTFAAGYNGDMYESSNIVVINTTSLQDVNGTWSCGHNSETATYELNPIISIPELKFGISPEIFSENISRSTPSFGLSVTYGCINVPVTFEWSAVSVESNAEVNLQISSTISVNSSICSVPDVYGYTTAIDTSDIFNVASGLSGFYSLNVEVHYTSGITALNSKEYPFLFIFSVDSSTQAPTTKSLTDKKCFLGIPGTNDFHCTIGLIVVVIIGTMLVCYIFYRRRKKIKRNEGLKLDQQSNDSKNSSTLKNNSPEEEANIDKSSAESNIE